VVDLMRPRWAGVGALAVGLGIAGAAQLAAPLATPPLYDGVVVVQPYVYVSPPAGKPDRAQGASAQLPMDGHKSPFIALATPEQPPQAQMTAEGGSLVLPSSATSLALSITPLDPSVDASATGAQIVGNVYRFSVTDQAGVAATAPASALVTVVLRAPEIVLGAQVGQLVGGTWRPLKSELGMGASYVAVVTSFGDFAVVVPGASSSPAASAQAATTPTSATPSASPGTASIATVLTPSPADAATGSAAVDESSAQQMAGMLLILLVAFIVVAIVVTSLRGRRAGR
jgi:hypothetical protein